MMLTFTNTDWTALLPLEILAVAGLAVIVSDFFGARTVNRYVAIAIALIGVLVTAVFVAKQYGQSYDAFFGGLMTGGFTTVFQEIVLIGTAGSIILFGATGDGKRAAGTIAIMLWSACGALLMAGAANLIAIFLGLELLSLGLYAMCATGEQRTARESALKYLILSSTATAFLLFGSALLFGASGSVALSSLTNPALANSPLFWMGGGLFLIGLAFKLSLVPFHTWTPDVFQGAPLPVTAFMSVVTKAGTLAVFARFTYAAMPAAIGSKLLLPVWIVAAISMIAGNVGMLAQTDLKRLLGYSGIAQVGYILVALAGGTPMGLRYAIYYLVAYTLMNLGAFAVAAALSDEGEAGADLRNYRGLGRRRPWLAAAMTIFLLALSGLPPTAGFLGKILILAATVASGYVWLGAALIVGTAISLYAYAKVVRAMYAGGEHEVADVRPFVPLAWLSAALCAAAVIVMTFYPLTPSDIIPLVR